MFDTLKASAFLKIQAVTFTVIVDFLRESKDEIVERIRKYFEPNNPDIDDRIEIPAEAALVATADVSFETALGFLETFKGK